MKHKLLKHPMVLLSIILMDILTGMEFDLFVPSFPDLQNHFDVSAQWIAALLSVNFIGYCVSLFIVGELADRYGRKPIILVGLVIFIIATLLCLRPPSYAFLLIGRFIQGIGISAPSILSFLIISDIYPLREQRLFMAILNGFFNIAAGFAPVVGSFVTLHFNWQGNFTLLLILGLMSLVMSIIFIPSTKGEKSPELESLNTFAGYLKILQTRPLILLMLFLLLNFMPYWIFVGLSPLLFIQSFGVSLAHFGFYQGLLAFAYGIGSLCFGMIIRHYDHSQKKLICITNMIFIASMIFIFACLNSKNPLFITLAVLTFVIGQIIPGIVLYPICLNYLPHAKARVSALLQASRLIVAAVVLQCAGYLYDGTFISIGIIINIFIISTVYALYRVMKNSNIMSFDHQASHPV